MSDWDARIAAAQSAARQASTGSHVSSGSSQDDPLVYIGKRAPSARRVVQGRAKGAIMGADVGPGRAVVAARDDQDRRPLSEAQGLMHAWYGTKKWNDWQQKLKDLNLLSPEQEGDFETTQGWWEKAVELAATFQANGRGKITPWDALEILAGDQQARDKRGISNSGVDEIPKPTTHTQTAITDSTTARDLVTQALTARLGRRPTEDEFKTLTGLLAAAEAANPTTTTTTYGANGQSSSQTTGGINSGAFVDEEAMNLPDYKAWQAVGYYGPMLFNALNSPVG